MTPGTPAAGSRSMTTEQVDQILDALRNGTADQEDVLLLILDQELRLQQQQEWQQAWDSRIADLESALDKIDSKQ